VSRRPIQSLDWDPFFHHRTSNTFTTIFCQTEDRINPIIQLILKSAVQPAFKACYIRSISFVMKNWVYLCNLADILCLFSIRRQARNAMQIVHLDRVSWKTFYRKFVQKNVPRVAYQCSLEPFSSITRNPKRSSSQWST
jgi:hypothetical protein